MDAPQLTRWTRFAAKGGIGRGTALRDCVAEGPDDLMFMQGDEIVFLMSVAGEHGRFLGYCEGVVGSFWGTDVQLHGKLKKAVFARRSTSQPRPSPPTTTTTPSSSSAPAAAASGNGSYGSGNTTPSSPAPAPAAPGRLSTSPLPPSGSGRGRRSLPVEARRGAERSLSPAAAGSAGGGGAWGARAWEQHLSHQPLPSAGSPQQQQQQQPIYLTPSPVRPTSASPARPGPPSSAPAAASASASASASVSGSGSGSASTTRTFASSPLQSTPPTTASELSTPEKPGRSPPPPPPPRSSASAGGRRRSSLALLVRDEESRAEGRGEGPSRAESVERGLDGVLGLGLGLGLGGPGGGEQQRQRQQQQQQPGELPAPNPDLAGAPPARDAERKRARRTGMWGSPMLGRASPVASPVGAGLSRPENAASGSASNSSSARSLAIAPMTVSQGTASPIPGPTIPPAPSPSTPLPDALLSVSPRAPAAGDVERTPLAQTGFRPPALGSDLGSGGEGESTPLPRSGVGRSGSLRPVGARPMPVKRLTGAAVVGEEEEVSGAVHREAAQVVAVPEEVAEESGTRVVDDRSEGSELAEDAPARVHAEGGEEGEEHGSDGEFGIGLSLLQTGDMSEDESELASLADEHDADADISADPDLEDDTPAKIRSRGTSPGSMPVTPPRSRPGSLRTASRHSPEAHQQHNPRSSRSSAHSARSSRASSSISISRGLPPSGVAPFPVRPPLVTRASTSTQASFSPADLYEAYELGMGSPAVSLRSQRSPAALEREQSERARGYFDFHLPEPEPPAEQEVQARARDEGDETLQPVAATQGLEPAVDQKKGKEQQHVPILASPPAASLAQRRRGMTGLLPPVEIEVHPVRPPVLRTTGERAASTSPAQVAAAATVARISPESLPMSARSLASVSSTAPSTATIVQGDGPAARPAVRRSVTLSALPSPASLSAGSGSLPDLSPRSPAFATPQATHLHSPLSPAFPSNPPHPYQQSRSFTLPVAASSSRTLSPSPLSPLSPLSPSPSTSRLSPANLASAIRARVEAQRAGTPSSQMSIEDPKSDSSTPAASQAKPRLVVVNLTPEREHEHTEKMDDQEDEVVVFSPPASSPARQSHVSAPVPAPVAVAPQMPLQHPSSINSMPNTPLPAAPLQPPAMLAQQPARSSAPVTPSMPLPVAQAQPQLVSSSSSMHSLNSTLNLARQAQQDSPATPTYFRGHMSQDLLSAQGPVPIAFQMSPSGAMVPIQRPQASPQGTVPPQSLYETPPRRSATQPEAQMSSIPQARPGFYPKPRPRSQSFSDFTTPLAEASFEQMNSPNEEKAPELARSEDEKDRRSRISNGRTAASPLRIRPVQAPFSMRSPLPTSPLAHSATSAEDDDGQVLERPPALVRREANSAPVTPLREEHDELGRARPALSVLSDSNPSSLVPTPSPPTMHTRSASLRSKISMNALRARKEIGPESPSSLAAGKVHTVLQVEDAEFEMVKPVGGAKSDEGSVDGVYDSPTSPASFAASLPVPPSVPIVPVWQQKQPDAPAQTPAQIEAYRNLEFRWVMLMQTLKPAGARKQKKVKKIVWEGVPNSVRGKVWAYLTDANARAIPDILEKLAGRGEKSSVMMKDLDRLFPDQPHLRDPNGSLVKLLQAYLALVPDVQYDRELAMIAGNIVSLSPEEDAFWTFVAVMDNQIRLYFAVNSLQLDVDGQLFAKAVEWMDAPLAKLLFEQCGVSPNLLCKAWFASVFCNVLPSAHLQRVWDIYLLEGSSFLFRTGLVILQSAKRHLMSPSTFPPSALSYLTRPPANIFDPDPDSFIHRVASVRMRDDDLKRLRPKIEAQLKPLQRPQIVNRDIIKPPTILNAHDTSKKALTSVS